MFLLANALPEGSGDGYVAAAYIVFFVILMIYVAIMALRLSHVERDLRDLQARTQEPPRDEAHRDEPGRDEPGEDEPRQDETRAHDHPREREPV